MPPKYTYRFESMTTDTTIIIIAYSSSKADDILASIVKDVDDFILISKE